MKSYNVWPKQINPCFGLTFKNDYENRLAMIKAEMRLQSLHINLLDRAIVHHNDVDSFL